MTLNLQGEMQGILLIDKPPGTTSFSLVALLRRLLRVQTVGHAGTLDPLATGVMILLIGRTFTRLSDRFLAQDKEYEATLKLGVSTDTYDADGKILQIRELVPCQEKLVQALHQFHGELWQVPPMFSAKKQQGKKLYELARKGQVVERAPVRIQLSTEFISYEYPFLQIRIRCSKGTYVRSIAHDLGEIVGCGAHLTELRRTKSGPFRVEQCVRAEELVSQPLDSLLQSHTRLAMEFMRSSTS